MKTLQRKRQRVERAVCELIPWSIQRVAGVILLPKVTFYSLFVKFADIIRCAMKRIMLILMSFAAIVQLSARDVIRLDRDWRFFNLRDGSSDKAQSVNLPHTWNADALSGRDDYFRGVCNYMKDVTIPAEWSGKQIYLRFSGVGTVTDLIVNGRYVGEHQGGYSAFTFNVTQYLKFGAPNTLWVMVNNAPRTYVLPVAGDFNVYGGIYRDVELIAVNPAHIAVGHYGASGVYVHQKNVLPQRAELETTVNVEAPAATAVTVGVTVLSILSVLMYAAVVLLEKGLMRHWRATVSE